MVLRSILPPSISIPSTALCSHRLSRSRHACDQGQGNSFRVASVTTAAGNNANDFIFGLLVK